MRTNATQRWTLLAAILLVAGCQSDSIGCGFLEDYTGFGPHPEREGVLAYEKPGIDLREYDELMIDRVVAYLPEGESADDLDAETVGKVATAFRRILVETISPYYTVVDEPGPHTMRLRIALTDVRPVPEPGSRATGSVEVGEAAMEAEMLDAASGERLAAVIDRIRGSTAGYSTPERWRHVEGAFREWSRRILDYIDRQHAGS